MLLRLAFAFLGRTSICESMDGRLLLTPALGPRPLPRHLLSSDLWMTITAWRPQTGARAATFLARRRVMLRLATATTAGYRRWRRGRGERVGQPPRQRQERLLRLPALGAGAGPRRLAGLGNQPAGFWSWVDWIDGLGFDRFESRECQGRPSIGRPGIARDPPCDGVRRRSAGGRRWWW